LPKVYIPGETKAQRKARKKEEKAARNQAAKLHARVRELPKPPPPPISPGPSDQIKQTDICFVLGNGTSRKGIILEELRPLGTIYGCNALYREFIPDYLIAVDTKMIREISTNGYQHKYPVWTNPNKYSRSVQNINLFQPNLGWSSGPTALNFASQQKPKEIYILGFDYQGIGIRNELVNNMYAGTENYKNINDRATYFGNWERQTASVIQKNPKIRYIRVVPEEGFFTPKSLEGHDNLRHITIEKFKKSLKLS